ncbi:MAG: NAD(P)H-dependent oxidoreductase [Pseudomonadota bacterium]
MTDIARHILRVDASMRRDGSSSRRLTDAVIARFGESATVTTRDLAAEPVPFVDEAWIGANFTDPAERGEARKAALATSDRLIAELKAADTLVIGLPIYNFGAPAALKAWIDMVARARETFRYAESGPVGLLEGKRAIIVAASGGTSVGGDYDFATGWLRHVLGFIGITDVEVIDAGMQMVKGDEVLVEAQRAIDRLAA